ncbi:RluA family pseudouridine synthase [Geobacter pelophilus]|uniref:RluA family pseudouridine synthase n=1 Tax=Geoanaerobacter pelophilus TaxID=60036 RepID=A0AAW4L378_9BACT|nr:RluA family pseudouridine synthase [Geoanaerobacter pelophilus]MBT0663443.1 RluA family pseudouridine synthase [Geoanaerobacter pelophilus]
MLEFRITEEDHCRPAGSWLRMRIPTATAGYINQLLKKGHVTVNGGTVSELRPLVAGDCVSLKESGRTRALLNAKLLAPEIDILYEDSLVLCINKPNGISMHAAAEAGETITERATTYLHARERAAHPHAAEPTFKLRPINRLDRGTSGGVFLAKSSTAAGIFGKLVMEGGLDKLYLALAAGNITGNGTIREPVEGKEALTRYSAIFSTSRCSLLALRPDTGRMHQIRIHLRHIGHPVMGDKRYGGPSLPAYQGFTLHSFRTGFTHPETGQATVIHAPLPQEFLSLVRSASQDSFSNILQQLQLLS